MKTRSAIDARSMSDLGSTPETSTRRNDTGRRARARSTDSALLTLGARSPSRSHSPAAVGDGRASRAPVEQLQRWGTSGEIREVAPGTTLGELMHRERPTPETTAHMGRLQQHNATHERSVGDSGSMVGMRSPSRGSPSTRSQGGVDPQMSLQPKTRAQTSTSKAAPGATAKVAQAPRSAGASPASEARTAKPNSIRALPSGPKINGMDNVLMSAYNLDDEELSLITGALGLGPAHADEYVRNMQTATLGRILRGAVYQGPPIPDAASIAQLKFGRGLPPERLQHLVAVAGRAGCFMTERQQRGKNGETQHLLQLHFTGDDGAESLASQPDSVNYKAVKALAELMGELTAPGYREDAQRFSIDSVAAGMRPGDSSGVFVEHFAKHTQASPPRIQLVSEHFNEANIRNAWLFTALTPEQKERLVHASNVSHLQFEERRTTAADGTRCVKLRVFFGGTENWRDVRQALVSGTGGVGTVFGAVRDAAEIIAQKIEHAQREGYRVEFDHIAGASMGGASAQLFTAALQSRVRLRKQPPLVLLDPQLPNTAQLRHAVKGGTLEYDYAKPRGVAVTLDYPANPRKGLMGRMKGLGFKSPGLVRLKLALSDYDATRLTPEGDTERLPPQTSGPPGMGYHADPELYLAAINRFTRRVELS
ncbi:UNVERIFIED_ORG: hypothetical protein J2Y81_006119 [Paraburkholderia sediminicola]|nr:hypothetical protein [Paraburkholderia sediminicola]